MPSCRRLICSLLTVALTLSAAGCTAMKTVRPGTDPSKPVFGGVKEGDLVLLHLRDGRRVEITVASMERDAFVSMEGVRYQHAEIAQLQKKSFSGLRTLGFAATVYLATAALVAIAVALLWGA
jgi:hypothetical protein